MKPVHINKNNFDFKDGLITFQQDGKNYCLSDLMHFKGKGTYDPNLGLVPVTEEEAQTHNQVLDQCRLKGMDEKCEIGEGEFAYFVNNKIITFSGTVISEDWSKTNKTITFKRVDKTYRGRLTKDNDVFTFKRIA